MVTEAYRLVLEREPDVRGLEYFRSQVLSGALDGLGVLTSMAYSEEFLLLLFTMRPSSGICPRIRSRWLRQVRIQAGVIFFCELFLDQGRGDGEDSSFRGARARGVSLCRASRS